MFDSSQRSLRGLLFQYAPIYNVLINLLSSSFTKPLFSHVPGTCHLKRYAARKRSGAKRSEADAFRWVCFWCSAVCGTRGVHSTLRGRRGASVVGVAQKGRISIPRKPPRPRVGKRERERGFGKCQQMAQLIWQAHQFKYSGGGPCVFLQQ